MKPIYRNTRVGRVRFLHVLFWAATLGFAAMAVSGGAGGSHSDNWILGAIMAPLFACCALGMEWYLRCYVTALDATPNGLQLETLSTFGRARSLVPWTDVEGAGNLEEKTWGADAPSIDNSSSLLRIRGRKLLIVDTTTNRFDSASLQNWQRRASKE